MAFESLSDKLQNVFKNLRSKGRLTEADVKASLKEVKMALLEADVNFKVVKQFIKSVTGAGHWPGCDEQSDTRDRWSLRLSMKRWLLSWAVRPQRLSCATSNELTVIMMAGSSGCR